MINRFNLYKWVFLIVFWTAACFGFVSEELLPPLQALRSPVMLLCDVLMIILGCLTIRKTGDLVVAGTFLVLSFASTIVVNRLGFVVYLNGFREFVGLLFAFPVLRWFFLHDRSDEFRVLLRKTFTIWLWVQAFCITWQFIRYGANDHGGGSMGFGGSGMTSMLIYLVSYVLIVPRWNKDDFFGSLRRNWLLVFLLYPTFLNETKISFIMFALYFALLVKYDRAFYVKLIFIIPIIIATGCGLLAAYFAATGQDPDDVLSQDFFVDYLYGLDLDLIVQVGQMIQDGLIDLSDSDLASVDIPRLGKMAMAPAAVSTTPGGELLGAGIGQFKGGSFLDSTAFVQEYEWLLFGSHPWLFFIFIQLGFLGVIWWIGTACYQFGIRHPRHLYARRMMVYMTLSTVLICFYNDSFRYLTFMLMCAMLVIPFIYPDDRQKELFDEAERERRRKLIPLSAETTAPAGETTD